LHVLLFVCFFVRTVVVGAFYDHAKGVELRWVRLSTLVLVLLAFYRIAPTPVSLVAEYFGGIVRRPLAVSVIDLVVAYLGGARLIPILVVRAMYARRMSL